MRIAQEQVNKITHEIQLHHHNHFVSLDSFGQPKDLNHLSYIQQQLKNNEDISELLKPYAIINDSVMQAFFIYGYFSEIDYFFEHQPYNKKNFLNLLIHSFPTNNTFYELIEEKHIIFFCNKIFENEQLKHYPIIYHQIFDVVGLLLETQFKNNISTQHVLDLFFNTLINYLKKNPAELITEMKEFFSSQRHSSYYYEKQDISLYFDKYILNKKLQTKLKAKPRKLKTHKI